MWLRAAARRNMCKLYLDETVQADGPRPAVVLLHYPASANCASL